MKYCMEFDDTNFIGIANAEQNKSFVDEDWEFDILLNHFASEMKKGHILVFQMTEEGIEHSWKVDVKVGTKEISPKCFRRSVGYIRVTDDQLFLVDYGCLTMAAQFEDEKVPDKNCSNYRIEIDSGIYRVEFIQFYNVDEDEYIGTNNTDILLNFIKVSNFEPIVDSVFWCTY
ncbi:hypothetical protein CN946_16575 [Bacillus sp. AFS053548]|nr:hypothetical protein [Bacillus sp. AFS053548]PGM53833.1 hypothetical protein CN946_16575 [Bacillus sp. AFS053548]